MRQDGPMMNECPKCGFSQPKDRYCANCGLDIDSFVPEPDPLVRKLRKNMSLQISVVVAIILIFAISIYLSQRAKIAEHLSNASNIIRDFSNPERYKEDQAESIAIASALQEQESRELTDATENSANPTSNPVTTNLPSEFIVTFAEASKTLLQQLATEGQIINETAQTRSFLNSSIKQVSVLAERDPAFRLLPGGQTQTLRVGLPFHLDFMHLNGTDNEDIGLDIRFQPASVTTNAVEFDLEGLLNLKSESGEAIATQEIRANFMFSPQSTLILVGFVPRQPVRSEDLESFSNTPLGIYESAPFISGTTDFVIFIQAR